jgi:hypothetical protein
VSLAVVLGASSHGTKRPLRAPVDFRPVLPNLPTSKPTGGVERHTRIPVQSEIGRGIGSGERKQFVGRREEQDLGDVVGEEGKYFRIVVEGEVRVSVMDSAKELVKDRVDWTRRRDSKVSSRSTRKAKRRNENDGLTSRTVQGQRVLQVSEVILVLYWVKPDAFDGFLKNRERMKDLEDGKESEFVASEFPLLFDREKTKGSNLPLGHRSLCSS